MERVALYPEDHPLVLEMKVRFDTRRAGTRKRNISFFDIYHRLVAGETRASIARRLRITNPGFSHYLRTYFDTLIRPLSAQEREEKRQEEEASDRAACLASDALLHRVREQIQKVYPNEEVRCEHIYDLNRNLSRYVIARTTRFLIVPIHSSVAIPPGTSHLYGKVPLRVTRLGCAEVIVFAVDLPETTDPILTDALFVWTKEELVSAAAGRSVWQIYFPLTSPHLEHSQSKLGFKEHVSKWPPLT